MEHLAETETGTFFAAAAQGADIPDKLYFRTGEVARIAAIKPYVLRFWETEFPSLGPKKSGTGHRLYRRKDVEMVLEIKRLLYDKRFTIPGARQALDSARQAKRRVADEQLGVARAQGELFPRSSAVLVELRRELNEILTLLDRTPSSELSQSATCDEPSVTTST